MVESSTVAKRAVAIVGCGTVGCGWAAAFARAGHSVHLFDASAEVRRSAQTTVESMLTGPKGELDAAQVSRLAVARSLAEAVRDVDYVQESVPERLELKRAVFGELGRATRADCILASSTSALLPSQFLDTLEHRERALVAHPFNPPHLIPLVEIVPSPWTERTALARATALLKEIGQEPVVLHAEIAGYVGNRLQAAVVCEAMSLVARAVVTPADLDKCMTLGLGRRWAVMGPFQTMALNSLAGFKDYVQKYQVAYRALAGSLDLAAPWPAETIERIDTYLREGAAADGARLDRRARDAILARLREFLEAS